MGAHRHHCREHIISSASSAPPAGAGKLPSLGIDSFEVGLWGKRGLGLGFNSAVISWESDKEYLEWQAEFTRDGEYECELVTTQMRGEGIAEVEIDGQVVDKTIKADNFDRFYSLSRTGADNSRCVYNLGKVKVEKGLSTIFLRRKGMGANIPLIQLNFRKI